MKLSPFPPLRSPSSRRNSLTLSIAIASALSAKAISVHAADLTVDKSSGNSPFAVTANATYGNLNVGTSKGGTIIQNAYTITAGELNLGGPQSFENNIIGTYNLGGNGILNTGVEIFGGIGDFNQTGGSHTVSGVAYFNFNIGDQATYNLVEGFYSAIPHCFPMAELRLLHRVADRPVSTTWKSGKVARGYTI